ncbi:MAG: hypothetical protein WD771_10310 [Gemmatimonadaceae bacterium]
MAKIGHITRIAALAAAAALAACGSGDATASSVVRTDSAGVRVITSTGADTTLAWRFDTVGVLRDSVGDPFIFEGLTTRRVVTDRLGRVYVLVGDPAVLQFGRDGAYLRSIGRKGGAPGEMEYPGALMVQGDSLAVLDHQRNALVRWGPTLEPLNDLGLRGALTGVEDIAFRSGGAWVETSSFTPEGRRTVLMSDTVGGVQLLSAAKPRGVILRACDMAISLPPFFGPELRWTASGPRLLATVGPQYDLRLYEGPRLIASIRREIPTRAPTDDDVRRLYPDGLKLAIPGGPTCGFPIEVLMTAGLAETMPFVFGLALLSDGTMWVRRSGRDERPQIVDVFASDGAYAGTVRGMALPVGLLPNGELLVPVHDAESGGQLLTRFRVIR